MKKQNQVPQSGGAQTGSDTPSEKPQAEHQTIVPSEVAQATLKGLVELENAGDAAIALAMMNADMIQEQANAYAEWENLTVPGFKEGVLIVSRIACEQFYKARADWSCYQYGLIPNVINNNSPLPIVKDRDLYSSALKNGDESDSFGDFEIAWGAMDHLLHLQGWVMEDRNITHAFQLCDPVREKLKRAWDSATANFGGLHEAFAAVELAKMKTVQSNRKFRTGLQG